MNGFFTRKCDISKIVVGVSENHMKNHTNEDVKMLTCRIFQNVTIFPYEIEKFFPNLETLRVSFLGLERISKHELKYPKLKHLYVGMNMLNFLSRDTFEYTPNLEYLSFARNSLVYIEPRTLNGLSKLRIVAATMNSCLGTHPVAVGTEQIKQLKEELDQKCGRVFSANTNLIQNDETESSEGLSDRKKRVRDTILKIFKKCGNEYNYGIHQEKYQKYVAKIKQKAEQEAKHDTKQKTKDLDEIDFGGGEIEFAEF
jgi:hypothetical protein